MTAHSLAGLIVLALIVAMYFLPTIVAYRRQRVSAGAILAANLLFGWTILGWCICLIWALSGDSSSRYAGPTAPRRAF